MNIQDGTRDFLDYLKEKGTERARLTAQYGARVSERHGHYYLVEASLVPNYVYQEFVEFRKEREATK